MGPYKVDVSSSDHLLWGAAGSSRRTGDCPICTIRGCPLEHLSPENFVIQTRQKMCLKIDKPWHSDAPYGGLRFPALIGRNLKMRRYTAAFFLNAFFPVFLFPSRPASNSLSHELDAL